jgi:hypothetical protein
VRDTDVEVLSTVGQEPRRQVEGRGPTLQRPWPHAAGSWVRRSWSRLGKGSSLAGIEQQSSQARDLPSHWLISWLHARKALTCIPGLQ